MINQRGVDDCCPRRDLNRQKPRIIRSNQKTGIAKPFEDQIGVHIIAPRNF